MCSLHADCSDDPLRWAHPRLQCHAEISPLCLFVRMNNCINSKPVVCSRANGLSQTMEFAVTTPPRITSTSAHVRRTEIADLHGPSHGTRSRDWSQYGPPARLCSCKLRTDSESWCRDACGTRPDRDSESWCRVTKGVV
jgi:hypothetical protein